MKEEPIRAMGLRRSPTRAIALDLAARACGAPEFRRASIFRRIAETCYRRETLFRH